MRSSDSRWPRKHLALAEVALAALVTSSALSMTLEQIKYGEQPGAAERITLLLRDFHPKTMLHVPVHDVTRARFPVWDVHNHVNDAR